MGSAEKGAQSFVAEGVPLAGLCVFCTESHVGGVLYAGRDTSVYLLSAIDG